MSLELDFGITVFLYVFESVSNFLSLTISLILCCPLSLNRSPAGSPLLFHFPFPDQGRLIPVSPCPGPRDPGRRAAGRSGRWREAAGRGRVNQCFPIRADMHFTPRDSPQPANWFKLFCWLNWCHPFAWSITARRRAFPLSSPFQAAAVYPGQGQVKEPRHRTQRKTTNRAASLGTAEAPPPCRRTRRLQQRGRRFLAAVLTIGWSEPKPGQDALHFGSRLFREAAWESRQVREEGQSRGAVRGADANAELRGAADPTAFKALPEEVSQSAIIGALDSALGSSMALQT